MRRLFVSIVILIVLAMCNCAYSEGRTLVAYFSWGGNTKALAETIASSGGFDLFRIRTVNEYPTDYDAVLDVAKREQNQKARPKLADDAANFSVYDTVFLGWPCWWGNMPMAVFTFLETHDFTGKRVIPFTTHGGSSWGRSLGDLSKAIPSAKLERSGLSVSGSGSGSQVSRWLESLGFTVKR